LRIAVASSTVVGDDWPDDEILAAKLTARGCVAVVTPWDSDADWDSFDLVVIRSTWDYTWRRDEFIGWAQGIGSRLRNDPALIEWNSDKRYLADLADAGLAVVPTVFAGPGYPAPELNGEVVVKPVVSAGARDTGRFGPDTHGLARELIERIRAGGGTAMIQPYLPDADVGGETAVVFIAGEVSHVLHKKAVLAPDEVAPLREGDLAAAEAMFRDDLVTAGEADEAQLETAQRVIEHIGSRFGAAPLYARVDMLAGSDGAPVLLELEAVEPNLYFGTTPGVAERLADAILAEATG
jgi:glutathione synthase/RimK-type ligase-like ATP-grasp enzyme